jgi:hypothetical protein
MAHLLCERNKNCRSCPRLELNQVFNLRRVACESGTPRGPRE